MSVNSKPAQALVYTPKALHQLVSYLRRQPRFALDTESDSLYSYHGKVCLIQISTRDSDHAPGAPEITDFLVDPLRLKNLAALGELFADACCRSGDARGRQRHARTLSQLRLHL
jgi:ribonuclease D